MIYKALVLRKSPVVFFAEGLSKHESLGDPESRIERVQGGGGQGFVLCTYRALRAMMMLEACGRTAL